MFEAEAGAAVGGGQGLSAALVGDHDVEVVLALADDEAVAEAPGGVADDAEVEGLGPPGGGLFGVGGLEVDVIDRVGHR